MDIRQAMLDMLEAGDAIVGSTPRSRELRERLKRELAQERNARLDRSETARGKDCHE